MIVGFVIEDNFITASYVDKDGMPAVLKQSAHKDEYELALILDGNFCYTTKMIENVKLANPKFTIFDNILTKPNQKFETSKGAIWNNRQLMAILFKKMIHDLNSCSIQQMSAAHIALPSDCAEDLLEDVTKSLKANGVLDTKCVDYQDACQEYVGELFKQVDAPVFVNLSMESISLLGDFDESIDGYKGIDEILMNQVIKEYESISTNDGGFDQVESYLIKSELRKIKTNILSNTARDEYHILLRDNYVVFNTPKEEVNSFLVSTMMKVKDLVSRLKLNSIVFTGRYAKYPVIGEHIAAVFDEEDVNYKIDLNNELKSKGILFN